MSYSSNYIDYLRRKFKDLEYVSNLKDYPYTSGLLIKLNGCSPTQRRDILLPLSPKCKQQLAILLQRQYWIMNAIILIFATAPLGFVYYLIGTIMMDWVHGILLGVLAALVLFGLTKSRMAYTNIQQILTE